MSLLANYAGKFHVQSGILDNEFTSVLNVHPPGDTRRKLLGFMHGFSGR